MAKNKEQKENLEETLSKENENIEVAPQEEETVQAETPAEEVQESETDLLKAKVVALEAALAKEKDDYVRLMAEFDNFRRRTSQEKIDLVAVASMDTIKGLLPVLDDCERAMAVLEESSDSQAAKEGTQLIYNKLMSYLQSKGLAKIEAAGLAFDTDLHEAIAQFPVQEEEKKGKVFDVVQSGYTLNGKVIRYAKVVVGI